MSELFLKHPQALVPTVAIVCTALVVLGSVIVTQWRKVRQLDTEAALKQDMLNRGMSVEDVERVLRASSEAPAPTSTGPVSDNEYYLIEKLIDEGKSADEIERVIRAFRAGEPRPALPERQDAVRA